MDADPLPSPPPIRGVSGDDPDSSPPRLINQTYGVGAALYNMGNTCFLNAVLQCMTHTVPLVQKLLSADHSSCSVDSEDFCSFCALRTHVNDCIVMSGGAVCPESFAYNLSKISANLTLGEQEDAHEFLHYLLDSLHTCCLDHSSKDRSSSIEEDTLVNQVFGGRHRSQLRCCSCGHCSDTFEPLLDISLGIDDEESLIDALKSFTKIEKFDDPEARFTCDGCKAKVSMEKQSKLDKVPEVVTLHLKRFKNNGQYIEKIDKFVEYPLELDLRPFLSNPGDEEQSIYELYAILEHSGSPDTGHYFCTIRPSPKEWYIMNDSKVLEIDETIGLHRSAYVLFYTKQGSSPWFSTFMESQKPYLKCNSVASPISVLDDSIRDPLPSSTVESSCSSSTEESEKDEDPRPRSDASPESFAIKVERDHAVATPRAYSLPDKSATGNGFVTQRRRASDHVIDVFHDEPVEDEKENHLTPQAGFGSRGSREAARPILDAIKDSRAKASFARQVRGMPMSRRLGFMSCIASQHEPLPHNKRRRLT